MPADRIRRVNELIHRTVSEILAREIEFSDQSFVTITHVTTSRDLQHTTIEITIIPDERRGSIMEYVQKRLPYIQHLFGTRLHMRVTPRLHFVFDEGEIRAQHMYKALDDVEREKK